MIFAEKEKRRLTPRQVIDIPAKDRLFHRHVAARQVLRDDGVCHGYVTVWNAGKEGQRKKEQQCVKQP